MDLDLGSSAVFKVKIGENSYNMSAPTVKQASEYSKSIKKSDDEIASFIDFIVKLGLPREVAEKLDVVQVKKLSKGLLEYSEKK